MRWVGYGVYVAVCWTLGLLALRAALRSGSLIEWAVAGVALAGGGIGSPLLFLPSFVPLAPEHRAAVIPLGVLGLAGASIALYFATWRVFRPRSVLAPLLCTAGAFAIGWSVLAIVFTQGYAWPRDPRWLLLQVGALWVPYPWAALEMIRHARRRFPFQEELPAASYRYYGVALAAVACAFLPVFAMLPRGRATPFPPGVVLAIASAGLGAALAASLGLRASLSRRGREALSPGRGA